MFELPVPHTWQTIVHNCSANLSLQLEPVSVPLLRVLLSDIVAMSISVVGDEVAVTVAVGGEEPTWFKVFKMIAVVDVTCCA
jgi:hypothetical protein